MYHTPKEKKLLVVILLLSVMLLTGVMGSEFHEHNYRVQQREELVQKRAKVFTDIQKGEVILRYEDNKQTRIELEEQLSKDYITHGHLNNMVKEVNQKITRYTLKTITAIIGISIPVVHLSVEFFYLISRNTTCSAVVPTVDGRCKATY